MAFVYIVSGVSSESVFSAAEAISITAAGIDISSYGALAVVRPSTLYLATCVPTPLGAGIVNGSVVPCPLGTYWHETLGTMVYNAPATCVKCNSGTFSFSLGSTFCTPCPSGTFTSSTGSTSCQQCPGGHYCPAGTSSWARLNCGRGSYCPDGSGAPTPCPYQVPPTGGWGALKVQGPAFLMETAHCLNHCFWNSTSGDGMLSKC